MRYQVGPRGWPVTGQHLIPPSTVLNLDKPEQELTPEERLALGKTLPIDATALDSDASISLWRTYIWHRERLFFKLDKLNAETFERLKGIDRETMERLWSPRKG